MALPVRFNAVDLLKKDMMLSDILEMNEGSRKFGLSLTKEDALSVIAVRDGILKSYGRIELDVSVTRKIIRAFQSSYYILQEDYVETLNTIHEIFYHLKNMTDDRLGDDDLVEMLRDSFENDCEGSLDLLSGRGAEDIVNLVRYGKKDLDGEEEE